MKKILVINGPNLNLLGIREPDIYGKRGYADLVKMIYDRAEEKGMYVEVFQSNHEGDIVDKIQQAMGVFDAIIINPAAYTHTSVAIADALKAVAIPAAEIHISDINEREAFRHLSYIEPVCEARFIGHGLEGYLEAIDYFAAKV